VARRPSSQQGHTFPPAVDSAGYTVHMGTRKPTPVGPQRDPEPDTDRRNRLLELRDILHAAIQVAEPKDLSALAGRYQSVLSELAVMPQVKEATPVDDLAARRRRTSATL
jgi:hypothetical protein